MELSFILFGDNVDVLFFSWLRGGSSGMSALEVGIPSGYVVHNFTLQTYVRQERVGNSSLRNAESYNDKAVFYFEYVSISSSNSVYT